MGPWIIGLLIVLGAGALAAALSALLHPRVSNSTREQFRENSAQIAGVVASLFAITASFAIVTAWSAVNEAGTTIVREASAIVDVYWYARGLDEPERAGLQDLLRDYTATVVEVEWPLMRDERVLSDRAWNTLDQLRSDLQSIQPATEGESDRYLRALERMEDLVDERQTRRRQATWEVPNFLWIALGAAGAIVVAVPVVFGASSRFLHCLLAFAAAAVVAIVLILISEINHPFSGEVTTGPGAMKEILVGFDRIDATRGTAP